PARWVGARDSAHRGARTFLAIFAPGLRRRTVAAVLCAASMMIGAWGTTTLLPTWIHQLAGPNGGALAVEATGKCFMLANAGGVGGVFSPVWGQAWGGRPGGSFSALGGRLSPGPVALTPSEAPAALPPGTALFWSFVLRGLHA